MNINREVLENQANQSNLNFLSDATMLLLQTLDFDSALPRLTRLAVPKVAKWMAVYIKDENDQTLKLASTCGSESNDNVFDQSDLQAILPLSEIRATFYSELPDSFLTHASQKSKLNTSVALVPLVSHGSPFGVMLFANADPTLFERKRENCVSEDLAQRIALAYDNAHFFQQAQNSIRVRDEFLSIASHELKTPLTPLKLQIQMLIRLLKSKTRIDIPFDKIDKLLRTSDRQLEKLNSLIDELLDLARINSGRLKLNIEEFDLLEMMRDVFDNFEEQIIDAKCTIHSDFSDENLNVHWDHFRTEQVIVNLLTNALKYGAGKPIQVSVKKERELIRVSVRDQGIGISEKDKNRIFKRFERAVPDSYVAGLGLGLFIANQIILAHGGIIEVQSVLGEGSVFSFCIPANVLQPVTSAGSPT